MSERTIQGRAASAKSNHPRNVTPPSLSAEEVHELIESRAYELYEHRGTAPGDEVSDWRKAEAEVVAMLLAEPQEGDGTKRNGRGAARPRTGVSNAAAAAPPRVNSLSKRKKSLKSEAG